MYHTGLEDAEGSTGILGRVGVSRLFTVNEGRKSEKDITRTDESTLEQAAGDGKFPGA